MAFLEKIELIYEQANKSFKEQVESIKGFPKDVEELTLHLLVKFIVWL